MPETVPQPYALFCDAGIVGKNGSSEIGVWAWVWVDERGEYLTHKSGWVKPYKDVAGVTSPVAELVAIMQALHSVEKGWTGTLYSDCACALGRVFLGQKCSNVPGKLLTMLPVVQAHVGKVRPVRLDGHPERHGYEVLPEHRFITDGIGHRGAPYSKWNVYCDKLCNDLKETLNVG